MFSEGFTRPLWPRYEIYPGWIDEAVEQLVDILGRAGVAPFELEVGDLPA